MFCRLILLALTLGLSPIVSAEPVRTGHVTAQIVSEQTAAQPGQVAWVGLHLRMDPHWHTYWKFPGDSGLPTKVDWKLPSGWKVSGPRWPLPKRILIPPLVNYGYEGVALIGFELQVPASAKPGKYTLEAEGFWLVCKEECIPEEASMKMVLEVAAAPPAPGPHGKLFTDLRAQQPQPLPPGTFSALKVESNRIGLELENDPAWIEGAVDFFPTVSQVVKGTKPPAVERGRGLLTLWMEKADPFFTKDGFAGVLITGEKNDLRAYEVSASLDDSAAGASEGGGAAPGILLATFFAFLGGVLLNLMPCVFPVLGIKVMALVSQGGGSASHARKHGLVYAAGVIVSFWLMTAALLALRAAGQSVGWGFQLQQPGFVLALILLFSLLAANMAGFFTIGSRFMGLGSGLAARDGMSGSFFTGMLAVVVATPCTAPFMGTAIGVVLAQPAWAVFLVFTALGFGLAAPFVLLCFQPALMRKLPKPGLWMEKLKEFFAFPLAATVVWLFWVFGLQVGVDGLVAAATGLLLIFFSVWTGRRFPSPAGMALTIAILLLGCLVAVSSLRIGARVANTNIQGVWKPYSETAVSQSLGEGRAVFVDFTAAWCITCQVNKTLVLDRSGMQEFFREKNVALFRADWTNHDPEITKALEHYGRIGVPMYLAFAAGRSEAQVLPQILTEDIVKRAFP